MAPEVPDIRSNPALLQLEAAPPYPVTAQSSLLAMADLGTGKWEGMVWLDENMTGLGFPRGFG